MDCSVEQHTPNVIQICESLQSQVVRIIGFDETSLEPPQAPFFWLILYTIKFFFNSLCQQEKCFDSPFKPCYFVRAKLNKFSFLDFHQRYSFDNNRETLRALLQVSLFLFTTKSYLKSKFRL